jgi:hypothetical protein
MRYAANFGCLTISVNPFAPDDLLFVFVNHTIEIEAVFDACLTKSFPDSRKFCVMKVDRKGRLAILSVEYIRIDHYTIKFGYSPASRLSRLDDKVDKLLFDAKALGFLARRAKDP